MPAIREITITMSVFIQQLYLYLRYRARENLHDPMRQQYHMLQGKLQETILLLPVKYTKCIKNLLIGFHIHCYIKLPLSSLPLGLQTTYRGYILSIINRHSV